MAAAWRAISIAIPAGRPVSSGSAIAEVPRPRLRANCPSSSPSRLVKPEETPRRGLPLDISRCGQVAGTTHADQPGGRVYAHPSPCAADVFFGIADTS
jgi:hypothetical protein